MDRFNRLPDNLKGALILMIAALGFSIMVALIKLVGERIPVTQILFIRQTGMVIMLAPVLLNQFPEVLKTRHLPLQLLRIVLALIAMLGGFTAIINMPLADAIALGFAKSFFITIFAVWILKETVGVYRWAAVAFGFLGVLIMLKPGPEGLSIYGLLAVMGAAAAGAVMVVIRLLSRTDSANTILAFQALGVGVVMAIPAMLQWVAPSPNEWAILVLIGVVSYFAQKANIFAFTYGEASMLASLDYVRLVYATLFGWVLFGELPAASTWVGACIIVLAALFTVHREAKRQQNLARGPDGRGFNNS
ncbi:MAG: DMT family transporter [Granulosicoccus sp.]